MSPHRGQPAPGRPPSRAGPGAAGDDALDAKLAAALKRLTQALRAHLQDQATTAGLSPLQVQVLARLRVSVPAERRVGELARHLDVAPPTMSDAVGTLVAKGLLRRVPVAGTRAVRLDLTASGRRRAGDLTVMPPVLDTLARLPAAAKATTLAVCLALIGDLQRRGVISVARMCTTCRFFTPDAHRGDAAPHHCRLLDVPLAPADLRVDCPEHEAAG